MQPIKPEVVQNIFTSNFANWTIDKINPLTDLSANTNFLVEAHQGNDKKKFVVKIYNTETRATTSCEPLMYNLLTNKSTLIAHKHIDGIYDGYHFLVTEFIQGQELLSFIEKGAPHDEALEVFANQIISFMSDCVKLNCSGYGFIDTSKNENVAHGVLPSWLSFLEININHVKKIFSDNSKKFDKNDNLFLDQAFNKLDSFIENNTEYFKNITPKLIPIDLNLRNFIVSDLNKLHIIDLESFLISDELLAYGELFGHVYKSSFGKHFEKLWRNWNNQEKQLVHFYAILSNLNVLAFKALHTEGSIRIDESYLWGNPNSFYSLISEHSDHISVVQ